MAPSHRERLLPAKGLPQDRNSLRQAGKKLSRFRLPHSRYHMVDLISLGPSFENGLNWTLRYCLARRMRVRMAPRARDEQKDRSKCDSGMIKHTPDHGRTNLTRFSA